MCRVVLVGKGELIDWADKFGFIEAFGGNQVEGSVIVLNNCCQAVCGEGNVPERRCSGNKRKPNKSSWDQ